MFKRLFWLALGVGLGVFVVRKLGQARRAVGPAGLSRALNRATDRLSEAAGVFTTSRRARERELREALGIDTEN